VFGKIGDYLNARSDRSGAEKKLAEEQKRLDREFSRKRKPFERAVGRLNIREHPRLREAGEALGAVYGGRAVTDDVKEMVELPNVERFLERADYRRVLSAM
jgi:hypothetical protein